MFTPDQDGVYARVTASPVRRSFGYVVLCALGLLLVYFAFGSLVGFGGRVFLLLVGMAILYLAERMRRATTVELVLTADTLAENGGRILARIDEIARVERGAFAAKPSNGFSLVMKTKQPRAWAPGLWWRIGTRVGVGGVTAAGASKFMAEQIALRLSGDRP
jgi:di/tricarboxylate transporter